MPAQSSDVKKLRPALFILLAVVVSADVPSSRTVVSVSPGADLQAAVDAAPPHAVVELAPGEHAGPLTVDHSVTIRGSRDAVIAAPRDADAALTVSHPDVLVEGLTVRGGWTGIDLLSATGSVVRDVVVEGAEAQGIRIYRRSATLDRVQVRRLLDPHAQGIEVLSAPDVVVRNSSVDGGKIGIVAHLSTVLFENNVVRGTTQVGVMIREMGSGVAIANTVRDASGAGLYCGDMSRCEFADNDVSLVAAASNARSSAGWGLVVHYRSTASSTNDLLLGQAGAAVALAHSRLVPESPLRLGHGATGIIGGVWALLLSLSALVLCLGIAMRIVPRGGWWSTGPVAAFAPVAAAILLVGLVVQSFHMAEHWLQLYRVRVDGVPSRGGLAGQLVDVEWVHFVYNAAVLGGLAALVMLRRRGWVPAGRVGFGDRLLTAAIIVQGYHLVEHAFKVMQHVVTGAKVNPGLLGGRFDLVLLHFGINGAVYLAFLGLCVAYTLRPHASRRSVTNVEPKALCGSTM